MLVNWVPLYGIDICVPESTKIDANKDFSERGFGNNDLEFFNVVFRMVVCGRNVLHNKISQC